MIFLDSSAIETALKLLPYILAIHYSIFFFFTPTLNCFYFYYTGRTVQLSCPTVRRFVSQIKFSVGVWVVFQTLYFTSSIKFQRYEAKFFFIFHKLFNTKKVEKP